MRGHDAPLIAERTGEPAAVPHSDEKPMDACKGRGVKDKAHGDTAWI
jgi:hypothetical protein